LLSSMTKGEIVDEIVIDANMVFDIIAVAEDDALAHDIVA